MTNEEMIQWATEDGNVCLEKLIWISKKEEMCRIYKEIVDVARMQADAAKLSSWPGGFESNGLPVDNLWTFGNVAR